MNKNLTELVFILDKSGSMAGLERDTIGGFNSMLGKQKQVEGECRISTVLFDNRYELLHDRIDIRAVSPMTEREYQVGDCTALLDAIGRTIHKANRRPEEHSGGVPGRKRDVRHHHRRGVELQPGAFRRKGQGHDRGGENIRLGVRVPGGQHRRGGNGGPVRISADRAVDYAPDSQGTALNFQMMSEAVASFRATQAMPRAPLEAIRRDMKKRGQRR